MRFVTKFVPAKVVPLPARQGDPPVTTWEVVSGRLRLRLGRLLQRFGVSAS
jgi:hypothetical protein